MNIPIIPRTGKALRRKLSGMQRGQAIVLIALAMVGLLAITGLAIDGATVVTRRADLQRATDAAVLGGVVELVEGDQNDADNKAQELFAGNAVLVPDANVGFDPESCPDNDTCFWSDAPAGDQLGAYRYRIRSSMPVQLSFLNVIGFSLARVEAEATAEYFPQADLFASSTLESGVIKTSIQSIFGPHICTSYGDPYTPNAATGNNGAPNPWWDELQGTYHYRIRVPRSFVQNYSTLRVELMDPDSYDAPNANVTVSHEDALCSDEVLWFGGDRRDGLLVDIDNACSPNNDFWFHRLDEIRGTPSSGVCGEPGSYDPESGVNGHYETSIQFELFYYQQQIDGSLVRQNLASYTSPRSGVDAPPTGHPNYNQHCTDLTWVSPGAAQGTGYDSATCPQGVPADGDAESPYAFAPDQGNADFEITLPTVNYANRTCTGGEMDGCSIDPLSDDIFVYLDVTGVAGASENGFEFWAGPDLSVYDVPVEMNQRNLYILTHGLESSHSSQGAVVSGLGHLPLNSNTGNPVDIPLMYIGPELAGQTVRISLFDPDSGSDGPITFFFDTIPQADWSFTTCDNAGVCPNQVIPKGNSWISPPFEFVVPSESDTPPVIFVGGILTAHYQAGFQDTYGWFITVESRPYLID